MGYFNPIYAYGVERFCSDAADAGIDGLIVVDLPPEEDEEVRLDDDSAPSDADSEALHHERMRQARRAAEKARAAQDAWLPRKVRRAPLLIDGDAADDARLAPRPGDAEAIRASLQAHREPRPDGAAVPSAADVARARHEAMVARERQNRGGDPSAAPSLRAQHSSWDDELRAGRRAARMAAENVPADANGTAHPGEHATPHRLYLQRKGHGWGAMPRARDAVVDAAASPGARGGHGGRRRGAELTGAFHASPAAYEQRFRAQYGPVMRHLGVERLVDEQPPHRGGPQTQHRRLWS